MQYKYSTNVAVKDQGYFVFGKPSYFLIWSSHWSIIWNFVYSCHQAAVADTSKNWFKYKTEKMQSALKTMEAFLPPCNH